MITFLNDRHVYSWHSTETDDSGETLTYHEARWHELAASMRGRIAGTSLRSVNPMDRDDLTQLALLDMWNYFQRNPEAATNTDSWICWRAEKLAYGRWCRLHARRDRLTCFTDEPAAISEIAITDDVAIEDSPLADILVLLGQRSHRQIVTMLAEGRTHREIGSALNITHKAVESQIRTIRKILEQHGGAELFYA